MVTQERHQPLQRPGAARRIRARARSGTTSTQRLQQAGLRPDAKSRSEYITNTNFQAGGPLVRNKLFYFGVVQLPGDARERPELPGGRRRRRSSRCCPGHEHSGHDRHHQPAKARSPTQIERAQPVRGLRDRNSATTSRTAAPARRRHAGFRLEGARHLRRRAGASGQRRAATDLFVDTKVSYNNTHFPLFQKTDLQPLEDSSTERPVIATRTSTPIMFRRRMQVTSNWTVLRCRASSAAVTSFKGGFDNGYTPEDVRPMRVDDVNLAFGSLRDRTANAAGRAGGRHDLQHAAARASAP